MALGLVAEEATMYSEDLEGEFKRALLASLKASLPAVLPTLTAALEQHFGQALAAAQGGANEAATAHAAVVTAALGEHDGNAHALDQPSSCNCCSKGREEKVFHGYGMSQLLHSHRLWDCLLQLPWRTSCPGPRSSLWPTPAPSRRAHSC